MRGCALQPRAACVRAWLTPRRSVVRAMAGPVRRAADVAVVGAGAAGLAAARELRAEGHRVSVFEADSGVGGTWRYSATPGGHTSMYDALRTNLPRELMAFGELPFAAAAPLAGDGRRYPGHREVLAYLELYAERYALLPLVQFDTRVRRATPVPDAGGPPRWEVETERAGAVTTRTFDALVVANGHYSQPRVPPVAGLAEFPGRVVHTHDYRTAAPFAGLRVVVVGAAASGEDISRDIATAAATVFLSAASWQTEGLLAGVHKRAMLSRLHADGCAEFADGSREAVDAVVFATGYHFSFEPFLRGDLVRVTDNCVAPLFEHVMPPAAPTLAFIGLPWKVVPFPMFELQARWVARLLSGAVPLPSAEVMARAVADAEAALQPHGPKLRRHAHAMTQAEQFDYDDRLAAYAQCAQLPPWRREMYAANSRNKRARPDAYRDVWDAADERMAKL
jgi:cation diffusion facilitator CzcD-associated flavoprotein CzcO